MRLFAALLPPDDVLDGPGELVDAVAELQTRPDADRLRWTGRASWHVTLAFYGEVPDGTLPALRERLARAAGRRSAPTLRLAGGGRFGDRTLWAAVTDASGGVERPVADVRRLAGSAAAAGRRAGLDVPEPRHFRAHLTLARARGRNGARDGAQGSDPDAAPASRAVDLRPYVAALDRFQGEPWTAGELALVRSRLPDSGVPGEQPRYELVAAWPLAG